MKICLGLTQEHIDRVFRNVALRGYLSVTEKCKISKIIALETS